LLFATAKMFHDLIDWPDLKKHLRHNDTAFIKNQLAVVGKQEIVFRNSFAKSLFRDRSAIRLQGIAVTVDVWQQGISLGPLIDTQAEIVKPSKGSFRSKATNTLQ